MSALTWDAPEDRIFETGVEKVALFTPDSNSKYGTASAWNGVSAITVSPEGAEPNDTYADNMKYATVLSAEDVKASIAAFTYPDEFNKCLGFATLATGAVIAQQERSQFGLVWESKIGNGEDGIAYGTKLHILYGCLAAPSEKASQTISESPELQSMSWEISTTPEKATGFKATAYIEVDSTKTASGKFAALETQIYGDTSASPTLPLPDAVKSILTSSVPGSSTP